MPPAKGGVEPSAWPEDDSIATSWLSGAMLVKEIVTFPGAGHSDHHLHGSAEEIFRWIEALARRRAELDHPEKRMRP